MTTEPGASWVVESAAAGGSRTCGCWWMRRVRARCFAQTDLASAHLLGNDREQAAAVGRDALRTAVQVSSARTLDRLRTLQRQAQPLRASSPHLRELDERITDFLTRSARPDNT